MPNYTGTPLQSDWEKLQRRRAINKALVEKSLSPYQGTKMVTGHAVDDRLGRGIGKIGTALIAAMQDKRLGDESKALGEKYSAGQAEGTQEVMEALQGRGNTSQYGPQVPVEPDRDKAAMILETNPYLKGNDSSVARALLNSGAYSGKGRGGYSKTFEGEDGRIYSMDMRDPTAQPRLLAGEGGEPLYSPKYTPRAIYNQSRADQLGTGGAELETDPATASAVEAAKQGRIGVPPQTKAQEAADKAQAESEQARAFNAQGITEQVVRVEDLLAGIGADKPTGSWVGSILDGLGNIVGVDVPGSIPAERLKTIGSQLASKPPRFEGPQSDHDVNLYKEMAGMVGNDKISTVKRQAKMEEFARAFAKYEEVSPGKFVDNTKTSTEMTAEKEARFRKRLEQERGQ